MSGPRGGALRFRDTEYFAVHPIHRLHNDQVAGSDQIHHDALPSNVESVDMIVGQPSMARNKRKHVHHEEHITSTVLHTRSFAQRMQLERVRAQASLAELAARLAVPAAKLAAFERGEEVPAEHVQEAVFLALRTADA